MKQEKDMKDSIQIKSGNITVSYNVHFIAEEGMVSAYIPAFDIYYSAPDRETAERRSENAVKAFHKYWMENQGWKKYILKLHHLGFKTANHEVQMRNMLHNRPVNAKFSPVSRPSVGSFLSGKHVETKHMTYATAS